MKSQRNILFYIVTIVIFTLLMWVVIDHGKALQEHFTAISLSAPHSTSGSHPSSYTGSLSHLFNELSANMKLPFGILIIQIITIILFSRLFGFLFNKINQPTVIGEIVAGIFLGPSFLGYFFPDVFAFIFPPDSLLTLQFLSQVGLILFMFLVGMELDLRVLKKTAGIAIVVSHASIIFPYLLGVILSYFLYPNFAPHNIPFFAFALFMGIAMSITAFPVLARIIQEKGLTRTPLGSMALTCGAIGDITAWCILAAVVAIVKTGTFANSLFTIGLSILYLNVMLFVVQPFLRKIGTVYISKETLSKTVLAFIFFILFLSAYITEMIGLHALFGAFLAGVIMPHAIEFKKNMVEKIEDISLVLLLPLFFAFTGLRTQIGLLNDSHLWLVCLAVILVAVAGKFGGTSLAARFGGLTWKDSFSLGVLMNTRGLMELIVLNIGYDLGIISPQMFAILVLMALITTFMTGPALSAINHVLDRRQFAFHGKGHQFFRVLISFGPPQMGSTLLRLATIITPSSENLTPSYTAVHFTPSSEVHPTNALIYEKEGFELIKKTANKLKLDVHTRYKATDEVQNEILKIANNENFNLLLLGSARSVFTENVLGGIVRKLLSDCKCSLGIFIDRGFINPKRVLAIVPPPGNLMYENILKKFYQGGEVAKITVTGLLTNIEVRNDLQQLFGEPGKADINMVPFNILLNPGHAPKESFDLMLISLDGWKMLISRNTWSIESLPSVLILKSDHLQ
ncbi:MAG: cation:proton antiporter [Bacteroidota bacterium]|nr:cation:proton antiporter [Bacteroidota bacterium]